MDGGTSAVTAGRRTPDARPDTGRWRQMAVCAAVGVGVVAAVHYGRPWADGNCATSGDCLGADASIQRNLLLAVAVPAASFVGLFATHVRKVWLVVPLAFALQGAVMLVVEHSDGFWLPLWLDMIIGAVTWASVAALAQRR